MKEKFKEKEEELNLLNELYLKLEEKCLKLMKLISDQNTWIYIIDLLYILVNLYIFPFK